MSWICHKGCEQEFEETKAFLTHLYALHGISAKGGRKQLELHLGTGPASIYVWKWTIKGREYFQSVSVEKKRGHPA
jgi:hypothetical protein